MQDGKLEEEQKYSSFGLPSEMTIGMEVESESPYMALFKDNADVGRWNMKPDGSLGRNYGIEVVSPILRALFSFLASVNVMW